MTGFSLAVLAGGYAVSMALSAVGMARAGQNKRFATIATMPFYWLLMSVAAWQALWDFAVKPFHWHKTQHGLSKMSGANRL